MSQTRITKHVEFAAAHSIKGAGKCENKHGHNWQATITVDLVGGELDSRGFIVNVQDIKQAAFKYDHDDLDKYFEYPSTEIVAKQIADDALQACEESNADGTFLVNVHLVETAHNSADASATNFVATFDPPVQKVSWAELEKRAKDAESAWSGGSNPTNKFIKRAPKSD